METSEKIVEAYVRYVKGWATIPNIRCGGQKEIDLLAIDPKSGKRYHVESGVSVSGTYSKLTNRPFNLKKLRTRTRQAEQRRTIGYFIETKFEADTVRTELLRFGFRGRNYQRAIVSWGWTDEAARVAARHRIELWDMRRMLAELTAAFGGKRAHYMDDTLRTMQLYHMSQHCGGRKERRA